MLQSELPLRRERREGYVQKRQRPDELFLMFTSCLAELQIPRTSARLFICGVPSLPSLLQSVFSLVLWQSVHLCALLPEGSQERLKSSSGSGPYNLHNGKTKGHIHLPGLTEKKGIWLRDGAGMNRPASDPGRIQKAGGAMSGCSAIYQASSSRGAILAIDGTPGCKAEIWGSLRRAGGNLCCCCCALNTNTNKWIVLVHLFPLLSLSLADKAVYSLFWLKGCGGFLSLCNKSPKHFLDSHSHLAMKSGK